MEDALNESRRAFISTLQARIGDIQRTLAMAAKNDEFPQAPVVTLNNGLRVANFCFEEAIIFNDGNQLPGCEYERVTTLEPVMGVKKSAGKKNSVDLFTICEVHDAALQEVKVLDSRTDIDIVLVPVKIMEALKEWGYDLSKSKARTRVFDKITNTVRTDQYGSGMKRVAEPESLDS
jgi:hypothetical protein